MFLNNFWHTFILKPISNTHAFDKIMCDITFGVVEKKINHLLFPYLKKEKKYEIFLTGNNSIQ